MRTATATLALVILLAGLNDAHAQESLAMRPVPRRLERQLRIARATTPEALEESGRNRRTAGFVLLGVSTAAAAGAAATLAYTYTHMPPPGSGMSPLLPLAGALLVAASLGTGIPGGVLVAGGYRRIAAARAMRAYSVRLNLQGLGLGLSGRF
jgi:hypothetical protein